MFRLLVEEMRHRRGRTATLGLGILVAAVSFSLLTSAATTSRLAVHNTVAKNFRGAYDVLVRPTDSFTPLERTQGLVQQNYLAGIYGGIQLSQWQQILRVPGVEVAAPIANLGYITPFEQLPINVRPYLSAAPRQLYRLKMSWLADRGTSRYPTAAKYVYVTDNKVVFTNGEPAEVIPGRAAPALVCHGYDYPINGAPPAAAGPFDRSAETFLTCLSRRFPDQNILALNGIDAPRSFLGGTADLYVPLQLAAVDPVQEDKLLRLSGAIVSGRPLRISDTLGRPTRELSYPPIPVIASTRFFLDSPLSVTVERLSTPAGVDLPTTLESTRARSLLASLPGTKVGSQLVSPGPAYDHLLGQLDSRDRSGSFTKIVTAYWAGGPAKYQVLGRDRLAVTPQPPTNPNIGWENAFFSPYFAPPGNEDVQLRPLVQWFGSNNINRAGVGDAVSLSVVGRFDPNRLPGFSALSKVPLETYYPPEVDPGDPAAQAALGGRALLPSMNLGGYLTQPPLLLTTLGVIDRLTNPAYYTGQLLTSRSFGAPISVVRVRVAGVTGPDAVSRERIRRVAQAIVDRTGLAVDVTAGSSPHPLTVQLPAGNFGRPALLVRENWVQKGAAVVILAALDRKSVALFALVLLVCGFFLANGAFAAVRARRREIGVLRCLGWSRTAIFRLVLGEMLLIGVLAGVAGTALAALFVVVLHLKMRLVQVLLVAPVAAVLAALAGTLPAWRAGRGQPMDSVRPAVAGRTSGRPVRGLAKLAWTNLRRMPGRAVLGAAGLAVGVAAFTALLAINLAFGGVIAGTRLGNFVTLQVRAVDYISVGLAISLGALSVADVLYLNLRERAAEMATLRAAGWQSRHLSRVGLYEGLGLGLLGSLVGTGAGLALAAALGGDAAGLLVAAALAGSAGLMVVVGASLVALRGVGRLSLPAVLSEE
jgi:putative ABC transport system permease protein